jgi:hypothetical protein
MGRQVMASQTSRHHQDPNRYIASLQKTLVGAPTQGQELNVIMEVAGNIKDENSWLATFWKWIDFITDFDDTRTIFFQTRQPKRSCYPVLP